MGVVDTFGPGHLTSVTSATSDGAQGIFSKITSSKSVHSNENDEVVTAFWSKFLLNLSLDLEEVC